MVVVMLVVAVGWRWGGGGGDKGGGGGGVVLISRVYVHVGMWGTIPWGDQDRGACKHVSIYTCTYIFMHFQSKLYGYGRS